MNSLVRFLAVMTLSFVTASAIAAPDVAVLPAETRGVVLFPDGETPVDGLSVRVWNADTEEVIFKTKTDSKGTFNVPMLEKGNHYVTVGPVRIDMRVLEGRAGINPQPLGFVVVIPKRMPLIQTLVPSALTASSVAILPLEPEIVSP